MPESICNNTVKRQDDKPKGFFLKYQDFKKLERILEEINFDSEGNVDFGNMKADEKEILWKIKTIIRNMESVRLRVNREELTEEVK